jgi:hypothetical protein
MTTKRFSASVAARLMSCSAAADLPAAIPNWVPPVIDSTVAAQDGTDVHSIFEQVWEYGAKDLAAIAKTIDYVAQLRATRRFKVLIEKSMIAEWLTGKPETTADLVFYIQDEIHVIDTKWGKLKVEALRNPQLLYYAATYGALAPKAKGVHLHILQPRIDNMDHWFADTTEVGKFMADAQAAEARILAGDLTFGPSDHGCQFCPANPHTRGAKGKPFCPAMMSMLYPDKTDEDAILAL